MDAAILSAIISGVLALLVATKKIQYYHRKDEADRKERESKEKREREEREMLKKDARMFRRPELEIKKHYKEQEGTVLGKYDLEVYFDEFLNVEVDGFGGVNANFHKDVLDKSKHFSVVYELENIGKTDIDNLTIMTSHKRTKFLTNLSSLESHVKNGLLSYSATLDKRIKVGETITIKISYNEDRILGPEWAALMNIGFEDVYRTFWVQPFFAPSNRIYVPKEIAEQDYISRIGIDDALECFRNPYKW